MHAARTMDSQTRIAAFPTPATRAGRRPAPRIVACAECGIERPSPQMLRGPAGPMCDRCAVKADEAVRARREAWGNLRTALGLVAATLLAAVAAVLASGRIPFVGVDPAATMLAFGAAAGLGALSLVWGAWAAMTGGDRRLLPTSAWRTAVRTGGALAATAGLITGLIALGFAILGLVA